MEDIPSQNPQYADEPPPISVTDEQALVYAFDGIAEEQYELNRRSASRAERLADALEFARRRPLIYAYSTDAEAVTTAVRCAVMEASSRLHLSESFVRSLAATADAARARLPLLWRAAREGFATLRQVEDAVALLMHFEAHPAMFTEFDAILSDLAIHTSPASFRKRATLLARKLAPLPEAQLHASAFQRRRVVVYPASDGMSWIGGYVATTDATAIDRNLTAQAKKLATRERGGRTRDQVRADLLVDLLRGTGTSAAVKTKIFVSVPLTELTPEAQETVRVTKPLPGGVDLNREPLVDAVDPIDADTARHLLLKAGKFTRVITDPVTGVILDMDRRSRKITRAQREWLMLHHGTCTRDGCNRRAAEADIDHWIGYNSQHRGPTNLNNLHPFCDPDHALKDTTKLKFVRRDDLTVQVAYPTGHTTRRVLERGPTAYGDTPPF